MWWTLDKDIDDVGWTVRVLVTNLEIPSTKIIEDVLLDGFNVENDVGLLERCVDALESMTQEVEGEMAKQEIHGWARVSTLEIVMDFILYRRELYSLWLRSTGPLAVAGPVEDSCGAGEDDRIPKDPVLLNIYTDEENEEDEARLACCEVPSNDP